MAYLRRLCCLLLRIATTSKRRSMLEGELEVTFRGKKSTVHASR